MNILYWLCVTLARLTGKVMFSLKVEGIENLVKAGEGGTIIAANHQSFLDPPLVAAACKGQIHFLARDTLFKGVFGKLIKAVNAIPISQSGADLASLKAIIGEVKKGNRVLVFPEGTRTQDGEIKSAAAGIGMIVAKSKAIVQPVYIEGAFEAWPRNEKKPKRSPVKITFGERLDFSDLGRVKSKEQYQEIADTIMAKISELKD